MHSCATQEFTSHGPSYSESRVYVTTSVQISVRALAPVCYTYRCMATLSDRFAVPILLDQLRKFETSCCHMSCSAP